MKSTLYHWDHHLRQGVTAIRCRRRSNLFLFLLGIALLTNFPVSSTAADSATCQQEYIAAFDRIDEIYEKNLQKNLESSKAMQITGSDSVELLSSSIGAYNCQLKMACALVQKGGSTLAAPEKEWANNGFSFPECGNDLSGLDASGKTTETKATWKNALEAFGVPDAFASCRYTQNVLPLENITSWEECENLRRTKVMIELSKISSDLKQSANEKRAGFLLAKFQELHRKFEGTGGDGLLQFAQKFVTKFKAVLGQIQCTVPQTQIR